MHWQSLAAAAAVALCAAGSAAASDPAGPPPPVRYVDQSLGFSYNRLGLQHTLGLRWKRPLSAGASRLLSESHASAGVNHTLTPSYTRLAAWAELVPLSVVGVRAGVEPGVYFGTFGSLMGFPGYDSPFGDDRRPRKAEAGAGTSVRAFVSPGVRLSIGPLAAASTLNLEWWRSSASDAFYYEPARDTLLSSGGDRLVNVSTVLVHQSSGKSGGRLTWGLLHDVTLVPGAPGHNTSQTVGVLVAKRLASKRLGLPSPTLAARVGYYASDPSREGGLSVALGVSVERPSH